MLLWLKGKSGAASAGKYNPFHFFLLAGPCNRIASYFNADYGRTTGYSLFNIPYYAPFFKSSGKYFAIIHEILIYDFFNRGLGIEKSLFI